MRSYDFWQERYSLMDLKWKECHRWQQRKPSMFSCFMGWETRSVLFLDPLIVHLWKFQFFWNLKCHSCDSPLFNYSLSKSIYGGDNVWRDPDMKNRATHICDANGENANILWLPSFWWPLNTKKAITRMLQKSIDLQSFTERSGQLWRSIKAMEVYFPSLGLKYPTPKSFLTSFQIHY